MLYETIKLIYLHFAYLDECKDYSRLLLVVIIENLIWVIISYQGAKTIVNRKSSAIKSYLKWLIAILILRIATYFYMYRNMYNIIHENDKWECDAVYEGGIYVISGMLETLLILFLMFYGM